MREKQFCPISVIQLHLSVNNNSFTPLSKTTGTLLSKIGQRYTKLPSMRNDKIIEISHFIVMLVKLNPDQIKIRNIHQMP
jgi:hypothetical protein